MTDVLRTLAASLLELPEEASNMLGQALNVLGDQLEKLSQRIDDLEAKIQGE